MRMISRQLPLSRAKVRALQSLASPMSAQRSRGGFTLVELMIVVTIIGLSVVAFAPGFSRAMAEREVSFATREILRIAKRARTESLGYRRAYLMYVNPGASDSDAPRVQLLRAPNNSCVAQAWDTLQATCDTPAIGRPCVEDVDFGSDVNFSSSGFTVRALEEATDGSTSSQDRALCWAPNGLVYTRSPAVLTTPLAETNASNTVNGGVLFKLSLWQDGGQIGRDHRVLIPLGGAPMVVP
jgi:prepilin-type N-terminal cleavage/methylation domain-containing protein